MWPTPLEDCVRLRAHLGGPRILIKRDDVNTLGAGGNKLRKLEFLLGRALADGADTVITFGALQTNHGRQTAAACARLGLACHLVLTASVPRDSEEYVSSGNLLLDELYGAEVHVCRDGEETGRVYDALLAELTAAGRRVATFPVGGSDGVGVLGYVAAAVELRDQLDAAGIRADRVVTAVGSAGTAAGLALGLALLDWPVRLDAVCVSHTAEESTADITRLVGEAAGVLGVPVPALDQLRVDDAFVGPGYGLPTEEMWAALRTVARTEGIALDPVYTGKAAAGLLAGIAAGEIGPDETVVFLHSGGLPGLFGYARDAAESMRADSARAESVRGESVRNGITTGR